MSTLTAQLFYGVTIPEKLYNKLGPKFYSEWEEDSYPEGESTHPLFELEFYYDIDEWYLVAKGSKIEALDESLELGQELPKRPCSPVDFAEFLAEYKVRLKSPQWFLMPS